MSEQTRQAKGGQARAAALTGVERKEIAIRAAEARWGSDLLWATHEKPLTINGREILGAVLENGKRVLTQESFLTAIGRAKKAKAGTGNRTRVDGLPAFLVADALQPFISNEIREATTPIVYRNLNGQRTFGYDALLLQMVCEVYLKLRDTSLAEKGRVPKQFEHIIGACDLLMRGFARVGIIALIDEATGYQADRARDALAKILEAFIATELRRWVETFPTDFYKELFRLRKLPYDGSVRRPKYIGHLTNDLVYSRLAPGVLDELRRLTPRDEKGRLKHHLHRRLSEDLGNPKLLQHLSAVTALMKASDGWDQFKTMLDRSLPKYRPLPLLDGLESKA
jgi:hypothetical protein